MASFFYAMVRSLRLKGDLAATVNDPNHVLLDKNQRMHKACVDVKNHDVWHALYIICALCHGPMLVLRFSDAGEPAMDQVFYWTHKTCVFIKEHEDEINKVELFAGNGDVEEDGNFDEELKMFFSDGART